MSSTIFKLSVLNTLLLTAFTAHAQNETFAKKPFPRQPKPKHRFSAVFGCFRPKSLLILPKYPLNPPRIPDNQASEPPFRQQQAHLAC